MSLIKPQALGATLCHPLDDPLWIEGIGGAFEKVEYFVPIQFPGNIWHDFFVTAGDFKLQECGILGNDFLSKQKALLDFNKNVLKVNNQRFKLCDKLELEIKLRKASFDTFMEFNQFLKKFD